MRVPEDTGPPPTPDTRFVAPSWVRQIPGTAGLSHLRIGLLESVIVTAVLALIFALVFLLIAPEPSSELLFAVAGLGATLLIAYVVAVTWIVEASRKRAKQEREERLGALIGVGMLGLIGIFLALGLAERSSAGHWSLIDDLCFGVAAGSILTLGIFVVMQPWIVHEWLDEYVDSTEST